MLSLPEGHAGIASMPSAEFCSSPQLVFVQSLFKPLRNPYKAPEPSSQWWVSTAPLVNRELLNQRCHPLILDNAPPPR